MIYYQLQQNTQMMQRKPEATTYSQKRVKQLLQRSQKIAKMFNSNNFYEGQHINVEKLKQKISQAKRKLLQDKQQELNNNSFVVTQKQAKNRRNLIPRNEKNERVTKQINRSVLYKSRSNNNANTSNGNDKLKRLATDLGDYQVSRKQTHHRNEHSDSIHYIEGASRLKTISNNHQDTKNFRYSSIDTPTGKNSRSVLSVEIDHKKIILSEKQEVSQFQMKISVLWDLYENIVSLMQHASRSTVINQKLVSTYIHHVNSHKFEFIYDLCDIFGDIRIERTIRMSRVLQNFSIFQMCLNYLPRKKLGPAQIINYLGYSSSSVIFIIKILLLTHETSYPFSQNVNTIIASIIEFQINSYKSQLRNLKQVLRRLQHNNQIISMIKTRCGKKHGKYCEEFIAKIIKSIQKQKASFYECANNIFEFLAFYLHYQNMASHYSLLSTPPSPFLSLKYSKTIIIEPWGVLAFRKNNKLVIRAHTGKFLAEVSDNCNIVFWTELMPKDAQVLTNLMPVKENIYWLYRYHCRQQKSNLIKIVDLVGCISQNSIIVDCDPEHYAYNSDIGINMNWKGQKKDVRLLALSDIIQKMFAQSHLNQTTLKEQLNKMRPQLQKMLTPKKSGIKLRKYEYR